MRPYMLRILYRGGELSADAYFQLEMTTGPFVCPVCVRHGVEACHEHKPVTLAELESDPAA